MSIKTGLTEKVLLYKIQTKKDPEAFAALYDAYVEKVYRFVYFKVSHRQDAEDITSTVFLKTWDYLVQDNQKPVKSFSGLVYQAARNQIVDFYRMKQKEQTDLSTDTLHNTLQVADDGGMKQVLIKADHEQLLMVLKQMKQEYQEVILLRYVEGYTAPQIAEILGKSQTSVRVTLHRGVKVLHKMIQMKSGMKNKIEN